MHYAHLLFYSLCAIYCDLTGAFFEKMVWQGNRPLWFGLFYALCLSIGLTVLFQWNKVKRVLKRGEEE